jgi:hypothetical protein
MSHQVFISYASEDQATADRVCAALEAGGISCWIAPRNIPPSADWRTAIVEGIDGSRLMVLILSRAADESPFVQREITRAVSARIPILPLVVEEASFSADIQFLIGTWQWLNASTPPLERHLPLLVESARAALARSQGEADVPKARLDEEPAGERVRKAARETETPSRAMDPEAGRLVPRMCDRASQERQFRDFLVSNLKHRRGAPQFYLVSGAEEECHDSLVERLVGTQVRPIVERLWGEHRSVVTEPRKLDWPAAGSLRLMEQELEWSLFREFEPAYMEADYSANALARLPAVAGNSVVVLQHMLHPDRWRPATHSLLQRYLEYWAALDRSASGPQFLIFLNILYPIAQAAPRWMLPFLSGGYDRRRIEREVQETLRPETAPCPLLVLPELLPPQRSDVIDWCMRFHGCDSGAGQEIAAGVFGDAGGRITMAKIQRELQRLHQQSLERRGPRA